MMGSAVPAGLALNPTTGKITGIPTAAGTSNLNIVVTDALGVAASKPFHVDGKIVAHLSTSRLISFAAEFVLRLNGLIV